MGLSVVDPMNCCWLVLTLASYHFGNRDLNEFNPGLGIEVPYKSVRLIGGEYKNSYERTSWYLGSTWTPIKAWGASWGLLWGGVSGYKSSTGYSVIPMILPLVQVEGERVGFNFSYAPKIKDGYHTVGLQLKVKW